MPTAHAGLPAPQRWEQIARRAQQATRHALAPLLIAVVACIVVNYLYHRLVVEMPVGSRLGVPIVLIFLALLGTAAVKWLVLGAVQIVLTLVLGRSLGLRKVPRSLREHVRESGGAVLFLMAIQALMTLVFGVLSGGLLLEPGGWWLLSTLASAVSFTLWIPVHALIVFEGHTASEAVTSCLRVTRHYVLRLIIPATLIGLLISLQGLVERRRYNGQLVFDPEAWLLFFLQGVGVTVASILAVSIIAELRVSQMEYRALLERASAPPVDETAVGSRP